MTDLLGETVDVEVGTPWRGVVRGVFLQGDGVVLIVEEIANGTLHGVSGPGTIVRIVRDHDDPRGPRR